MNRRLAVLALGATALFGLTACTGAPAADGTDPARSSGAETGTAQEPIGGQTIDEACNEVATIVQEAASGLEEVDPADPAAATAALRTIAAGIGQDAATVTNPDIAALLPDLQTGFDTAAEVMEAVAAGDVERAAELQPALTGIQDGMARFAQACSPE